MRKLSILLLAVLALGLLTGCGAISMEDGVITVDISLPETTINQLISQSFSQGGTTGEDPLFNTITGVELIEPDLIRVFGEGQQDGAPVSGSYDVSVGAEDGALRLAMVDVAVPGVSLDDPRVVEANRLLTESFNNQVRNEGGQGVIQSAAIENNALRLVIAADLSQ